MIELLSIGDVVKRLGFPRGSILRNWPLSIYKVGEEHLKRIPLKEVEDYEKKLLDEIEAKYKARDINFIIDQEELYPFLISGKEVREKWKISHSTQGLWVREGKTGKYATVTGIGKSKYFVRAEVDFIEKGLAGGWRSRAPKHENSETIYKSQN